MADIGAPEREVTFEPVEEPSTQPVTVPAEPEREKVPVRR